MMYHHHFVVSYIMFNIGLSEIHNKNGKLYISKTFFLHLKTF